MAQKVQVDTANTALAALLAATMSDAYGEKVDVKEASGADFDDNAQLVLQKVAVRVRFGQAEFGEARDISRTTLSAKLTYEVVCRHESLRSKGEMRNRTLRLIACVAEQLAGARLQLDADTITEPLLLLGVFPVSDKWGPVEDCYALSVEVGGYAQYTGVNATPAAYSGGAQ